MKVEKEEEGCPQRIAVMTRRFGLGGSLDSGGSIVGHFTSSLSD